MGLNHTKGIGLRIIIVTNMAVSDCQNREENVSECAGACVFQPSTASLVHVDFA